MLEFLLKNWMLVLTALVSGFFLVWPQIKGKGGAGSIGTTVRPSVKAMIVSSSPARNFSINTR